MHTSEERAKALVVQGPGPGGVWCVQLTGLVDPPVMLSPHSNPAAVKEEAARVRQFVAAVIREAMQTNKHAVASALTTA